MRKLVLLCSLLALSVNIFAQINRSLLRNGHLSPASLKNLRNSKITREEKIASFVLLLKQEKISAQKNAEAAPLTPIYDDVYIWLRDVPGKKWVYDSRIVSLVYDVNDNLLNSVTQKWNTNAWFNDRQVLYTYDINNLTSELWQQWNGTIWVNDYINTKTYTVNNAVSQELSQLWNGSVWVNDWQSLYFYDPDFNQIRFTQQLWNGSAWENSYQEVSTYNTDNKLTTKISQFWDGSVWTNGIRDNYTYDTDKKLIYVLEESSSPGDIWINFSQSSFSYDISNNLTNELQQIWNSVSWENYSNTIYTYDESNNQKDIAIQMWNGASWVQTSLSARTFDINNYMESETNKDWTNSVLTGGDSTFFNIHTIITAISEQNAVSVSLYPNPGNGIFTIKSGNPLGKIEIFRMSGEMVYSDSKCKDQNSYVIDISNYAKGIYLLKVKTGGRLINRKIVLK